MTAEGSTWHGGKILGKPRDRDDARRMLKILSGAHHLVTTGVTLRSAARMTHFTSLTYVWFRTLTDEEIAYYVDTFQPFDKAGAYGIQEWIGYAAHREDQRLVLQRHGTADPESLRRIGKISAIMKRTLLTLICSLFALAASPTRACGSQA